MQALAGLKVVDLTHALAGSFCTYHLGLVGAEILKIEPPRKGDEFRDWRPPTFAAANAGKRSMTLDLKSPEGKNILMRLLETADVLTENFRPGVAAKLGLDWDKLKVLNPRLIYCSISGFGQTGKFRDYPAMEWSVQAIAGITDTYISPDEDPRRLGISLLDPFSGYMGFASILTAVLQREKTGVGQRIDVGMLDAAWVLNATSVVDMMMGDRPVSATLRATAARFRAKDRSIYISVIWPKWFEATCDILGAPELLADPRFADEKARNNSGEVLVREFESRLAAQNAAYWEEKLIARGVPAGVVRTIPEVAAEEDMNARGLLNDVVLESGQTVKVVGAGFKFEHDGPRLQGGVPGLGEANKVTLKGLGFSDEQIAALAAKGVI